MNRLLYFVLFISIMIYKPDIFPINKLIETYPELLQQHHLFNFYKITSFNPVEINARSKS